MAVLTQIDQSKPIDLCPYQFDLESAAHLRPVESVEPITLTGRDVELFLGWCGTQSWKGFLEEDLQCLAVDSSGNPLLTTWMPLVVFRYRFTQDTACLKCDETKAMLKRLFDLSLTWRDAGVDTVDINGRRLESDYAEQDAQLAQSVATQFADDLKEAQLTASRVYRLPS
ncbi:hypothetical protein [Vibrio parahaemolyticus]|uniref:hypothetical protein n=1 Tax=Vibrio parahaemolyticus TaxID=670 RepID=UPI002F508B51